MGQSKTETTTANKNPWSQAVPNLTQVLGNAGSYMATPSMFTPEMSGTTKTGIGQLAQYGTDPTATATAGNPVVQGSSQGYNAGLGTLMGMATGSVDPRQNPALMDALKAANQITTERVNSQFSGAGRFGSGANTLALGRALNETNTSALMNQYNTNVANRINAANSLQQGGFQGVGAGQAVDASRLGQANATLQAGGLKDQYSMAQKQAPLRATEWGAGITTPIASLGGSQDATTTQRNNPNIAGMIGGGLMTGLGLMTGNPMMAMGGASGMLGGLGGGLLGGGGFPTANGWSTNPGSWMPKLD